MNLNGIYANYLLRKALIYLLAINRSLEKVNSFANVELCKEQDFCIVSSLTIIDCKFEGNKNMQTLFICTQLCAHLASGWEIQPSSNDTSRILKVFLETWEALCDVHITWVLVRVVLHGTDINNGLKCNGLQRTTLHIRDAPRIGCKSFVTLGNNNSVSTS